jgi:PEGA domain
VNPCSRSRAVFLMLVISVFASVAPEIRAQNKVLGEVEFSGASKVENTSGVWVDGQYVGYLGELKGSKKLLLLPGEHQIVVRQGGFQDFAQKITLRAGEKQAIPVKMEKDLSVTIPRVTAEIKLDIKPNRAAVFVDGVFIGHVAEFTGIGKALLVQPGKRVIRITLPGYQTFETSIELVANQKSAIKTDLVQGGPAEGAPLPAQN